MSYYNCQHGGYREKDGTSVSGHDACNGYIGPLDDFACQCKCHEQVTT